MKVIKTGPGVAVAILLGVLLLATERLTAQTTRPAAFQAQAQEESVSAYDVWSSNTLTGNWGGLRDELEDGGFRVSLSYQYQSQQNFKGGLNTHNAYDDTGSWDLVFRFDFEQLGLYENGGVYFKGKGSFNDGINDEVGALSTVNSDANGDHPVFVKKWWYWHRLLDERVELRLGMLETNKDLFDVSLYANHEDKDFLNKGSIRNRTVPHGTGIGAYLNFDPLEHIYLRAAIIDRQARNRRTGFDTAFHDEAWFTGFWEGGWTPEFESAKGRMPGRFRIGAWLESGDKTKIGGAQGNERNDMGFYIGADQMIWKENDDPDDEQGLGLFARYGWADEDVERISGYWQAGASYRGLIPTRNDDVCGFSVSQTMLSKVYRQWVNANADRETVYEWFYLVRLTSWLLLTPDLQVITQPGGDTNDRNAVVGGVRCRVIF